MKVSIYFVQFYYTEKIEIDLFDGERIVGIVNTGTYRQVWIEGNAETANQRFRS